MYEDTSRHIPMNEAEAALSQELQFHRRIARPGTFVDIGAHTGNFTLPMSEVPGIVPVAIEPLPPAFAELSQRAQGKEPAWQLFNAALSDRAGTTKLNVPVLGSGGPVWEWASTSKDFPALRKEFPEIVDIKSFDVSVLTLDSLKLKRVCAIKLDAEGSEYEVLRGSIKTLKSMRPVVSVELEERHRAGCTYAVPAFMDALGYSCFFEIDGEFLPFARFDRATMQRGSPSPASHDYSKPYVNCFYFLPSEETKLFERVGGIASQDNYDRDDGHWLTKLFGA
jgi:FkbM family methyltransferase